MRARYVRVGPLAVFWWAGSWTFPPKSFRCEKCRNLYVGPFGFELDRPPLVRPLPEEENENPWP